MQRTTVSAKRPWGGPVGYSRAMRVGNLIEVAGTSATSEGGRVAHPNDAYSQTREILETVVAAIEELGGRRTDVIRTRVFLTDVGDWEQVAQVHAEYFGDVMPASTIVGVSALLLPELCVEIEATAWVDA